MCVIRLSLAVTASLAVIGSDAYVGDKKRIRYATAIGKSNENVLTPFAKNIITPDLLSSGIINLTTQLSAILVRDQNNNFQYSKENVVFAPLNIMKILSLVMVGAAGDTAKEIAKFLGLSLGKDLEPEVIHSEIARILMRVNESSPPNGQNSVVSVASGVFVQEGFSVRERFRNIASKVYNSDVYNLDFKRDGTSAANRINEWVSNATRGRIKEIVRPPLPAQTKVVLAGALFFKGNWEKPFLVKATRWQPFHVASLPGPETIMVEMMVGENMVPYYNNREKHYHCIGLPYKNRDIFMYIVVPHSKTTLESLSLSFGSADIETIVQNKKEEEVLYVIPKMKLQSNVLLRTPLQQLGVSSMFTPAANFSNLADGIYADEVIHKVELATDEVGTTASAASAVVINRGGYVNFRVDKPFIFFIYLVRTNVLTFYGHIHKPSPNMPVNFNER